MKRRVLSALAAVVVGCMTLAVETPRPLFVWNATSSAPVGLYHRQFGGIEHGDWVLIHPPFQAAQLAASRSYFPRNIGLIKRVAAQSNDRVCRSGQAVSVNGRHAATALIRDSRGRELPSWSGCVALKPGEIFVLNAPPASFDSRYFGPVPRDNVIERIAPLWTF
jgi:conjugative transfer signal peptidase TraF